MVSTSFLLALVGSYLLATSLATPLSPQSLSPRRSDPKIDERFNPQPDPPGAKIEPKLDERFFNPDPHPSGIPKAPGLDGRFNPQPDPPGKTIDPKLDERFNPQPDPPGKTIDPKLDERFYITDPHPSGIPKAPGLEGRKFNPQPIPPGEHDD